MLHIVSAFVLLFGVAVATPTTPFLANTSGLPWHVLWINASTPNIWPLSPSDVIISKTNPAVVPLAKPQGRAQFNESLLDLGWDFLRIESSAHVEEQFGYSAYVGGYLEGYLTAPKCARTDRLRSLESAANVSQWVDEHIAFMESESKTKKDQPFWRQIGLLLAQLAGLRDGRNKRTGDNLTFKDVFLDSFGGELGDVANHFKYAHEPPTVKFIEKRGHCSALIKWTVDDLYFSHDTWGGFRGASRRIYKVYNFGNATVAFSGYPGSIASGDDWYQTSHQLAIMETTNEIFNTSLFQAVRPRSVSEFMRVMAANFLATNGEEWTRYFADHNSGTYNNQYMVVDWKVFVPNSGPMAPNLLWVAEQIPGYVARADLTEIFIQNGGYWASYNIPYFGYIYQTSGYQIMKEQQGTFWSYHRYARPMIFQRNNTAVTDLSSMMRMMRYNNYATDPLSLIPNCQGASNGTCDPKHSAMLSIASRGDLMPLFPTEKEMLAHYGPLYFFVAQGCFGAIDSKIASYKNRHSLTGYVISGPTNDQQPTFEWKLGGVCNATAYPGTPTKFDFPWVEFVL